MLMGSGRTSTICSDREQNRFAIYVTEAGKNLVRLLQTGSVSEANRLVGF